MEKSEHRQEDDDMESFRIQKDDRLIIVSLKLPIQVYKDISDQKWKVRDGPTILYPLLHSFKGLNDFKQKYQQAIILTYFSDDFANQDYWNAYKEVNMIMAQEILRRKEGTKDLVWINDFHFLLTPFYLREQDESARIGLFLHASFPNSQIVSIFPQRNELLKSMLNCNLIGFHLFEYAKNFMLTCNKLLDLNYEFRRGGCLGIDYDGRNVMLRIGHVGIEKEYIDEVIIGQEFSKYYGELLKDKFKNKIVIAAVDYLHPISGIDNKLRALHNFLQDNPKRRKQVIFIQYAVPMRTVGPKLIQHQMFKKAIESILEVANQIKKDFGDVLQLKFEGPSKGQRCALWARANLLLNSSLKDGLCLINQIKETIEKVLGMSESERVEMFDQASHYLDKHSTLKWARAFLTDLKKAYQPGTIPRKISSDPEPCPDIVNILDQLTRDQRNTVLVISPHSGRQMHEWYHDTSSIILAAEDGYQYRLNSTNKNHFDWNNLLELDSTHKEWMNLVEKLMDHYVDQTDGAFVERRDSSIVFDFSDADRQFSHMIVQELGQHIDQLIGQQYQITKVYGQTYFQVKPLELKKSITNKFKVDFILFVGEACANQEAFCYLNKIDKYKAKKFIQLDPEKQSKIFTCTVGKRPTNARYCFKDTADMCELLKTLSNNSVRMKRNKSAPNLIETDVPMPKDCDIERKSVITSTGSINKKNAQYLIERIKDLKKQQQQEDPYFQTQPQPNEKKIITIQQQIKRQYLLEEASKQ
ncbi:trehalose-6-phosohate synthase [Stylonychia lemnae]|uniref:Trehalose-6-phosohate synthase n=1 Tax=Stylonychia lemnae TaxID=5949 RepID=A0A078AN42_STYLE|nr:trehalose-6-phosohate synthase [Stylonychia lemnae]|eukprot:CDW83346.1 trehalose-6-phosohate synthase [Stylonychia lemnae]